MNHYEKRREALRKLMQQNKLDALLVSAPANRYYLSGFELYDCQAFESSGYLIITQNGKDMLCTDSRYADAARKLWDNNEVYIYGSNIPAFINNLLKSKNYTQIGFDEESLPFAFVEKFRENITITPAYGLVEKLRIIKDDEEIRLMKESAKLNHKLMEHLPQYFEENIHKGITEKDAAWHIECFFRENGASANAFKPIVAKTTNAAMPHYEPQDVILTEDSFVLVDVGARLNDYCSDQTRTFWIGNNPSDRFKRTLEQVQNAQKAALNILKAGLTGKEGHEAAYAYFQSQGVEKFFTHSLGHGVGLETHENPRLAIHYTAPLEAGMIVTVEPGLYYPEWGGIRWEYMALITENGFEIL